VFVGVEEQGLFRSTDCGATWVQANTGRYSRELGTGGLWELDVDPVSGVLWAGTLYGEHTGLLRSINGGTDWDPVFPPGSAAAAVLAPLDINHFQSLSIDPDDHNHVVITFHSSCGANMPACLAESMDSGVSWRLFRGPFNDWLTGAGPLILGGSRMLLHTMSDGVFYTDDAGGTWSRVFDGSGFQEYRASDGYLYLPGPLGVFRSLDGMTWERADGPNAWAFTGDGERMFGAPRHNGPHYFARAESGGDWVEIPAPLAGEPAEVREFAYDGANHVLYAAQANGLFRMRTR
jgi:photosystem II stability/assembly factor-like uncharacterized protein